MLIGQSPNPLKHEPIAAGLVFGVTSSFGGCEPRSRNYPETSTWRLCEQRLRYALYPIILKLDSVAGAMDW